MNKFLNKLLTKERTDHISCVIKKDYEKQYQKIIERTKYLPDNCRFTERIYQIINNLKERPAKWHQFPYKLDVYNKERLKSDKILQGVL